MLHYYSRIPAAAIFAMFDGNQYARIPHTADGDKVREDFENPRMVRYVESESFIKNGEAYILFAKRGDAIPITSALPFSVTVIHVEDQHHAGNAEQHQPSY